LGARGQRAERVGARAGGEGALEEVGLFGVCVCGVGGWFGGCEVG